MEQVRYIGLCGYKKEEKVEIVDTKGKQRCDCLSQ
jgi:hypothetical protein